MAERNQQALIYQTELDQPLSALPPLSPGQVVGLEGVTGMGLTTIAWSLMAAPSQVGMVVAVDVRGLLSPLAASEAGVALNRLVIVRCPDRRAWAQVTAASLEGVAAVFVEVPMGMGEIPLRRLAALNRARRSALILRSLGSGLPGGVVHWRVRGKEVAWNGMDHGHGRLEDARLVVEVSGKSIPPRTIPLALGPQI